MRKPTQDDGTLYALQAEWPNWTPASRLAKISLQYSSRIFSLRRKGWQIATKIEIRNGIKYGYFRLGSPPVPRSSELRASRPKVADALIDRPAALFDMHRSPDRCATLPSLHGNSGKEKPRVQGGAVLKERLMSGTKVTAFSANGQIRLRPEVLAKLREEMRRIAINGTAQGRRYAHGLSRKYPELRNV